MKIVELQDGTKKVEVTGQIIELGQTVDGAGWTRADATLKDDTGSIKLVLWDKDTLEVSKGDVISIENGYVKAYQGTLQLSRGKYGTLKVLKFAPKDLPKSMEGEPFLITIAKALEYQAKNLLKMAEDCRSQCQ